MPQPPRILACDIATTMGVADGRAGETPILETVRLGGEGDSHLKICARALGWIAKRLTDDPPDIAYLEAPMPIGAAIRGKSNARSIIRLNSLYGIIGGAVILKGLPVHEIDVRTVRQTFIGHANLEGGEAKRRCKAMCRLLGWTCNNVDEADAGALWHFRLFGPGAASGGHRPPGDAPQAGDLGRGHGYQGAVRPWLRWSLSRR